MESRVEAPAETWTGTDWRPFLRDYHTDTVQIHPLLTDIDDVNSDGDGPSDVRLRPSAAIDTSALETPDGELAPILEQLRRSLENMQGNHGQVEGINEAMTDAQAALDDVIFKQASVQQYAAL